jgi:hypothetical protein
VKLDVNKPLTRVVGLHPEGYEQMVFQVLYEKLTKLCDVCGLFGHGDLECGDGDHDESAKQYGPWLVAPMEDWQPTTRDARMRMLGVKGMHGGGRGGGRKNESRKRPHGEGPQHVGKTEGHRGTLELMDGTEAGKADVNNGDKNNLALVSKGSEKTGAPISPVKPPAPKKPKKTDGNDNKAGSRMERCPSQ